MEKRGKKKGNHGDDGKGRGGAGSTSKREKKGTIYYPALAIFRPASEKGPEDDGNLNSFPSIPLARAPSREKAERRRLRVRLPLAAVRSPISRGRRPADPRRRNLLFLLDGRGEGELHARGAAGRRPHFSTKKGKESSPWHANWAGGVEGKKRKGNAPGAGIGLMHFLPDPAEKKGGGDYYYLYAPERLVRAVFLPRHGMGKRKGEKEKTCASPPCSPSRDWLGLWSKRSAREEEGEKKGRTDISG